MERDQVMADLSALVVALPRLESDLRLALALGEAPSAAPELAERIAAVEALILDAAARLAALEE